MRQSVLEKNQPDSAEQSHEANRSAVLFVSCLALVMVVSSVSMLNQSLRQMSLDLGASGTQQHWIIDSYALVFAAFLLPFGALGDKIGRRSMMITGSVVMGAATLVASFAGSAELVIACRSLAGLGAAMVMPGTLSSITAVFPPDQRGKAIGTWAGVASASGIIGLLVSGSLLEFTGWQSVFRVTTIVAVITVAGLLRFVPETKDPAHANVDPVGSALSVAGIGALVFGVIEAPVAGWSSATVIGSITAGVLLLCGFVWFELRSSRPVLDVRLFANRAFGAGSFSVFCQFFALFGFIYIGVQYLQGILGYSPLRTAFAMLPMGAILVPLSRTSPTLARRFGLRTVNCAGLLLIATGFFVVTMMSADSGYGHFLVGVLIFAAGMALATAPASESIVNSLPPSQHGVASAVNDSAREVGGALGIAVIGSVFATGYTNALPELPSQLPPEAAAQIQDSAIAGLAVAGEAAPRLGANGSALLDGVREAFVSGMGSGLTVGVVSLLLGAGFVAWRSPRTVTAPVDG
jgi:EmrB/QacA subfamily drug resistance transporter